MTTENTLLQPSGLRNCKDGDIYLTIEDTSQLEAIKKQFYISGTESKTRPGQISMPIFAPEIGRWFAHETLIYLRPYRPAENLYYVNLECLDGTWDRQQHVYPISPNMTVDIVNKGVYHKFDTDQKGYVFTQDTTLRHKGYELEMKAALEGVMQPYIRQYQVDWINGVSGAAEKFTTLSEFYGKVIEDMTTVHRGKTLGYYADTGLDGHIYSAVKSAIYRNALKLRALEPKKYSLIGTHLTYILNVLRIPDAKYPWVE